MQQPSRPGDDWIEEALAALASLTPGMEGEVGQQQAAICLLQARRDGRDDQELERIIQGFAIEQLERALNDLSR
ncbi:hypothetical protein [Cyanobium sp. ATX 6F1]|uniref:hypothetical protein n=1 Tax=unclassified Cyanobium TaxID=2627006 RepID=UPI0020CD6301|nr:hypothetical protein [Cyanobium sp. ATX 6F1]MCP9917501.1 hypothetical protein [Cyanobium sp. ATX 6F1]